MNKVCEVN